jgi:esterase/lipase
MFKHKAVLIIHGIAGGTYDEEGLLFDCEQVRDFDVYQFTLPGHNVKSIKHTSREEWIGYSEDRLKYLIKSGYKTIYLVGHSMGGVIATYLATKHKEVKKIVLIAPSFTHIEKEEGGMIGALIKSPELVKAYSLSEIETRITKLPPKAIKEFLELCDIYQYTYRDLTIPVLLMHGSKDQLVPIKSTRTIFPQLQNKHKVYVTVRNYYHDIFNGPKLPAINKEIISFLKKPTFMIKMEKKEI